MIIYTDGSAHPNPGPGGYGVVVCDNDNNIIDCYQHQELNTTNNIQELKAILYCMLKYGVNINTDDFVQDIPTIYSDSSYAINTYSNWMFVWARNNWLKSDNKVPENLELIQAYYDWYNKGYRINLKNLGNIIFENLIFNLKNQQPWDIKDTPSFFEGK